MSSFVVFFKYGLLLGVITSVLGLGLTLYMWMVTNLIEGFSGGNSFQMMDAMKFSFILFIFSESMFFFAIFWAFLDSALSPSIDIGGSWSPMGIIPVNPFGIPLFNTVVLLSSSVSLTWAFSNFIANNNCHWPLVITLILAALFEMGQYLEYRYSSFSMADGIYGSIFYFGTGFHGLHVIVGHIFLGVNTRLIWLGWMSRINSMSFEMSIIYWHFVDVIWLFLFTTFYVWSYGL